MTTGVGTSGLRAEDEYWLAYRAGGSARPKRLYLPVHEDFDLLRRMVAAAANDEERWHALDEGICAAELLERDDSGAVLAWLASLEFDDPSMQVRYVARVLAPGLLGTEVFGVTSGDVEDLVWAVESVARGGELRRMPDFVALGLPGAFLAARAIQDGDVDVVRQVRRRLSRQLWSSLQALIPVWNSHEY